ncbi:hypothetical protein M758_4G196500 [Ceratodon purpureus]|nr:hypothetical protein M758_4G196500 [Ceratodon purpureus]
MHCWFFLVVIETHQMVFDMLRLCLYQDHYKVLGVDYDATDDSIRTSYLRLALKWHPDKHNGSTAATLKFQEINEAYRVLSDPLMRHEYDMQGNYGLQDYNYTDYLKRFKSLILTCNGLGISSRLDR